jgi:hypothetical protein
MNDLSVKTNAHGGENQINKYRVYFEGGNYVDIPLLNNLSISESTGEVLSIGDMCLAINECQIIVTQTIGGRLCVIHGAKVTHFIAISKYIEEAEG